MTTLDSGFTAARWRRFGHDRLYVSDPDGISAGYRDLKTGSDHPVHENLRALIGRVADAWAAQSPVPTTTATAPVASRPWIDLSLNEPGRSAREQALTHRHDAPVRTALGRIFDMNNDERAWRLGADGEELVASQLAKVSRQQPTWTAIHAIPIGSRGADIDHVVIGPGGVFTVNAKHHRGADIVVTGDNVRVNGFSQPYVRNARHEGQRAARLLSAAVGEPVAVTGLVVIVGATSFTVKRPSRPGVTVLSRKQLADWLLRLGSVLDQGQLNRIWESARRSTTWED